MIALVSVRQHLQQAATDLGEDLIADIVLTLWKMDGPASTRLHHALRVAAAHSTPYQRNAERGHIKVLGNKGELTEY